MGKYIGPTPEDGYYFYGLSRTNDGELTFGKLDLNYDYDQSLEIVDLTLRDDQENQHQFQGIGTNYFDGRDENHVKADQSLKYEQYKWSTEDLYYFIDSDGNLVMRTNRGYDYPEAV